MKENFRRTRKACHRSWAPRNAPVPGRHRGDIMSPEKRRALMARIRGEGTGPEKRIIQELIAQKLSFAIHVRALPGRPDVVFTVARLAVFIDGSFWHGWRFPLWEHKLARSWRAKIASNRLRDQRNFRELRRMGWRVIRIWEHQVERNAAACIRRIAAALGQNLKGSGSDSVTTNV